MKLSGGLQSDDKKEKDTNTQQKAMGRWGID